MIHFDKHAFKGLDVSLEQLYELLETMAGHIGELVALLPRGLEVADPAMFEQAKLIDRKINACEEQADKLVEQIVSKFTAGSDDLRFILGAIKIASELERAADKLKNCVKRLSRRSHPLDREVKADLAQAITAVERMISLSLSQVLDFRPDIARELLERGAAVQKAYRQILIRLHHSKAVPSANDHHHILLAVKNLEQTADMAVEIMKIAHVIHFGTKYEKEKEAGAA